MSLPVPDGAERLSDEEAAALWQRAAQLQADAMRRTDGGALPGAGTSDGAADAAPRTGYSLDEVRAAAAEAGISAPYVALALEELRAAPAVTAGWQARQAPRLLGATPAYLAATRVVDLPPAEALAEAGRVLQAPPFGLRYRDTVGPHPLEGGVVVFELPGPVITGGLERLPGQDAWYNLRGVLEAETVRLTARPAPGDARRTEVTLHADLRPGLRRNVNMGLGIGGMAGAVAALPTFAAGAALAGGPGGLAAAAGGALAALVAGLPLGTWLGARAYGAWYRSFARKAERELADTLRAVDDARRAAAVFGSVFGPPGGAQAAGVVPGVPGGASLSPAAPSPLPKPSSEP